MNASEPPSPIEAVLEVTAFLEAVGVPYVIIGGLAVQHWGDPRFTRDIDITVMVPAETLEDFFQKALERFVPRLPDAVDFARSSRVLLLMTDRGIPIDLTLGIPGYEDEVMRRAVAADWLGSRPVPVIGCEDLIIHKCVAGRPRDWEDVRGILERQRGRVDLGYIRAWLREFAALVPERDVVRRFEGVLRDVGSTGT